MRIGLSRTEPAGMLTTTQMAFDPGTGLMKNTTAAPASIFSGSNLIWLAVAAAGAYFLFIKK